MEEEWIVYLRTDSAGRVTGAASSGFLKNTDGWTEVARGKGDKYLHAQARFLPGGLLEPDGVWRYRLEEGGAVLRTADQLAADRAQMQAQQAPDNDKRLAAVEAALLALMGVE